MRKFRILMGLGKRRQFEAEMNDELQFHLEARVEDLIRSGVEPAEARRRARIEFGSVERAKEECRDSSGWWWADELRRNLAFGLRILRRNPDFTLSAIATLGLCIGVNTAVFSLVDAVLLRPLPYPEPDRLAVVATRYQSPSGESVQTGQDGRGWELIREQATFLERAVFSAWATGVNLSVGDSAEHVREQRVGAGFFSVLGVDPLAGREFTPDEDAAGGPAVTVLSHGLARRLFGEAAAAVGEVIQLRGEPQEIIGVMPAGFDSGTSAELWTPLRPSTSGEGQGTNYQVLARLPEGMTLEQAQARLAALGGRLHEVRQLSPDVSVQLQLVALQESQTESVRPSLAAIWAAVGLVLLLGCVNIAGLLMARLGWRRREIATRLALGGGRGAVLRQLLTEGLVLAVGGGLAGIAFASLGQEALEWLARDGLGMSQTLELDGRALAFTALVALATSLLFGLVPALQASRTDLRESFAESDSRGATGGGRLWPRRLLVVTQVAGVVVLLMASGLVLRTVAGLRGLSPGFDPRGAVTARISLHDSRYGTRDAVQRLIQASLQEIRGAPGVEAAGVGLTLPYERALNMVFQPVGEDSGDEVKLTNLFWVTPGYSEALGMTLLRGRWLSEADGPESAAVVLVNRAFARRYFPDQEALGRQISVSDGARQIVGIVGDVQVLPSWGEFGPLGEVPAVYMPLAQASDGFLRLVHTWFSPAFVVRSRRSPQEVAQLVEQAVASRDPGMPLFSIRSMEEIMAGSWARQQTQAILLGALAGLALLLAAVGIWGLIANSVLERRREMGIRIALGATLWNAVGVVALPGVRLTLAGIAIGGVAAYWLLSLIEHLVWGVRLADPLTFAAVAGILLLSAALASLAPSLRIVRLDPSTTLRE